LEKEQNIDPNKILEQIKDTCSKTIIGLIPYLADFARISINPNIDQLRCFQIFGFDILVDKKLKAWLLEVNANPSLNMYLDKELPNGDLERTLCDLDKYLKSMVMQDAIQIVKSRSSPDAYGCYEKILPSKSSFYDQFYIWEEARKIFERLGGVKSPEFISSSQFQRLSKLRGMTNGKIVKASYDIMYKNVVNRSDSKLMAMEHFFDALEILAAKLFKKDTMYESLNDLIMTVKDQHI
jgi:tubulin polyglutamylase TTLL11